MKTRTLAAVAWICFSVLVGNAFADQPLPNIIHILTDDLGWQDPVCFDVDGDTPYETPHLDRLAKNGRMFMQAYSPSPTCSPSRAAYISGQYPARTGIYHVVGGKLPRAYYVGRKDVTSHINPFYRYRLPLSDGNIAKELNKAGYTTGHVGKWHLGGRSNGYPFPGDYGFDLGYTQRINRKGGTYYPDPDVWGPDDQTKLHHNGLASKMKPDRLSDFATDKPDDPYRLNEDGRPFDKTLDVAMRWMDKHHGEPFFLNFCTYYVHAPIQARNRERFAHYCQKMGYEFPTDPGTINRGRADKSNPYYATMVDTLDWMIGEVVVYLEETDDPRNPGHKLIDNTYLIVSSDNGGLSSKGGGSITDNSPLKGGKQHLHEGGVRVPFIVRGPGVPADTQCNTPISLIDLYPTFVDMAKMQPSNNPKLDGCNIMPLILGEEGPAKFADGKPRESIYFYFPSEHQSGAAMRKGPWKIYRNLAPGINRHPLVALYRLYNDDGTLADIGEEKNLADKMPELRDELLADLDRFMEKHNVTKPYKNPLAITELPGQSRVPKVTGRGSKEDLIWVTIEAGEDKSPIVEAKLLYTVNGQPFDYSKGQREMWFDLPAKVKGDRVEATVPPGTSHAALCMVDAEGFLVMSEKLPAAKEVSNSTPDSSYLKHAWPYRPGLFALVKLGDAAAAALSDSNSSLDRAPLQTALSQAKSTLGDTAGSDKQLSDAIRTLRNAIRNLKGHVPQAEDEYLNLFRPGGKF